MNTFKRPTTSLSQAHVRVDINLIFDLIPKCSRVLDLGCGEGDLLSRLIREKNVAGSGVEISEDGIRNCIQKGLDVCQLDIDQGLADFGNASFDYVVLNQTLQVVRKPDLVIAEMLRVGRARHVGFPNFGHWYVRLQLALKGQTPRTAALPFYWYNTPNIRMITLNDFKNFCKKNQIRVLQQIN